MKNKKTSFSRREFIKLAGLSLSGLALRPWSNTRSFTDFPEAKYLARVTVGKINIRSAPDINASIVGALYEDAVQPWLREVVGYNPYRHNQNFVETPLGYIWSADLQPVTNESQTPVADLPNSGTLGKGMWVQVTLPYVDVFLENANPIASFVKNRVDQGLLPRLYYSQVFWVNGIRTADDGSTWYRVDQHWDRGDVFWGPAEAFRPITEEEISPISPDVDMAEKLIEVNLRRQTMSAYEAGREVYFCRVSTGKTGEKTATPVTPVTSRGRPIWRKMLSAYMEGNVTGAGYAIPGIGYTSLFTETGIAIHATFWHNNYGEKSSHGCVNASPEDAKWIFRWTYPIVGYDPGDVTVSGDNVSTRIKILE